MRITLNIPSAKYPVVIEPQAIRKFTWPENSVVITDTTVHRLYVNRGVSRGMWRNAKHIPVITFPAGETHKRLAVVEKLCAQLVQLGADRFTSLIAFGGGVVGDVVGLVASLYMRGVPLYHVPTTLLAMVDSSLGGKTGVDLDSGKNLIGTIYQPRAVIMDPQCIIDLPNEQFRQGMGEVVKHGVIDGALFYWLEKNVSGIMQRDPAIIQQLIVKNVRIKARVVEADERETGQRMVLNLGHTFAHAIEQLSRYTIPHGEAVAIGLHYAVRFGGIKTGVKTGTKTGVKTDLDPDRLSALLHAFGLPSHLMKPFPARAMVQAMMVDKKNRAKHITLVVPRALGDVRIQTGITPKQVERFLDTMIHDEAN